MSTRLTTAAKLLAPFVAFDLAVIAAHWFAIPEGSPVHYILYVVSALVLPFIASARLAHASFPPSLCVASSLSFATVEIVWVAVGVAVTHGDWRHLAGFIIANTMFAIPVQLMSAYLGARFAHRIFKAAT
jgi:hypothetical protein